MVASPFATQDERSTPREPIAIIGIGCRFPGGIHDPRAFWRALLAGVDAITEIPSSRFDLRRFYDARPATPGKVMTRWGGFLDDVDRFDAYFFGISPREADRLDPQQRLLLEVAFEALEDAGQGPQPHSERQSERLRETGVFAGVWLSDYEARLFHNPADADFYMTTGSGRYSAAGRLSYQFGFQGPSVTVDTACSSSLVAVHLACQSLRSGECDLALAGGVNVILQPQITIAYSQSKMMAPDGRCKFGDARGDGYVRSEGAGMIVLKRLSQAAADGDPIYAVIRGSAVNNDGRSSGFLATPGTAGQEDLLRKAYRDAGVPPAQVQYIEAHGTGTRAGDPVEIEALGNVLSEGRPAGQFCAVGSVKTNLGHTEGAAGIAGLIKVALSLQNRTLPASLHFQNPNPAVPWERIPMRVQAQQTAWPPHEGPAVAGVSAFGIAGTNAHIVLAEAPDRGAQTPLPAPAEASAHLLPLSAHTPEALEAVVAQYRAFVTAPDAPPVADLCYTASVRRTHHSQRAAFVGSSLEELAGQLEAWQGGDTQAAAGTVSGAERKIAFVFSGQGSQWLGMGRSLLQNSPVFRAAIEACDRALRAYVDWSLLEQLAAEPQQSRLEEISVIQPTLFAVQAALAAVWRSSGVEPQAVIGHSMGEVAAAYVAGALTLEEAAQVICVRSRLMQEISGQGAMLVVDLPLDAAQAAASPYPGVSAAVSNSRRSTVLSGDPPALEALEAQLKAQEIFCRFVKVDVAAHSPQMDPLRPRLEAALSDLRAAAPAVPIISTVTGAPIDGAALDAAYWGSNLRRPVLFAAAVEAALADGCNTFIEISPHPVLTTAVEQSFAHAPDTGGPLAALASCRRNEDESASLLRALGDLYTLGYPADWARLYAAGGRPVPLPTYPWQREHFWYDNIPGFGADAGSARQERLHPLLGWEVPLAGADGRRVWENSLDARELPLLYQHRLHNTLLLPAAALLGALVAAGEQTLGSGGLLLSDVQFQRPLLLDAGTPTQVQTVLTAQGGGFAAQLYSRPSNASGTDGAADWTEHVACRLEALPAAAAPSAPSKAEIARRLPTALAGTDYYADLAGGGITFGDLRPVQEVRRGPGEALADLASAGGQEAAPPLWLDGLFQLTPLAAPQSHALAANGAANGNADSARPIYTPARLAELRVYARAEHASIWAYARLEKESASGIVQNLLAADAEGAVLAEARGLELVALGETAHTRPEDWLYTLTWQAQPLAPAAAPAAPAGDWIIFADRGGVGAALASAIRAAGGAATVVLAGDHSAQTGAQEHTLDPLSAEEMHALWARLLSTAGPRRWGIVHLWGLDGAAAASAGLSAQELLTAQQRGLASALHLAQAAAAQQLAAPAGAAKLQTKLWIVTQGAQRSAPADDPSRSDAALVQAPLWGLGRVLGVEHPDLWGGLIDLAEAPSLGATAAILWAELSAQSAAELTAESAAAGSAGNGAPGHEVALDAAGRYAPRLLPAHAATATAPAWRGRSDAAYLITGGLGGLGLLLAQWMVEGGARRLILLGRTPLPPRKEWAGVDPDSRSGQQIAAVRRLEAQGAAVHPAAVDVGDEAQLRAFLDDYAAEGWPPIRGVVHAAGTVRDRLLANLTWPEMAEVLHAKVRGGYLLADLLPDLDFFVLFSSVGAVLGQPGQGNYAAANAFLDALARRQRSRGQAALSINWGPWAGVGFAALAGGQHVTEQLAQQGIAALAAEDGLAVLRRLMGALVAPDAGEGEAEVLVLPPTEPAAGAPVRSPLLRALHAARGQEAQQAAPADGASAATGGGEAPATALDTLRALEPAQRRAKLAAYVQGAVAQVLRMPAARVGLTAPLGSLGLDSLMALELRNRLESAFAIALPATFAWNYPTVQELTPYLAGRMDLALEGTGAQAVGSPGSSPAPAAPEQPPPAEPVGAPEDELGGLDQLLAGIDALSDESALDLLKAQRR